MRLSEMSSGTRVRKGGCRGFGKAALTLFFLWAGGCVISPAAWAATALCSMQDGQPADGKTVFEKQGKKYEFCCSGCLQRFKEMPDQFAEELDPRQTQAPMSAEAACSSVCSD